MSRRCARKNEQYERIAALLKEGHTRRLMREEGLTEAAAAKRPKKLAIEDARFVLPNACETKMIVTMNARSLHNFSGTDAAPARSGRFGPGRRNAAPGIPGGAGTFAVAGPSCVKGACPKGP